MWVIERIRRHNASDRGHYRPTGVSVGSGYSSRTFSFSRVSTQMGISLRFVR